MPIQESTLYLSIGIVSVTSCLPQKAFIWVAIVVGKRIGYSKLDFILLS